MNSSTIETKTIARDQPIAKVPETVRILLIEDDEMDAILVSRLLESVPNPVFEVDHVERLDDGLQRLGSVDYDIAILDMNLPDGDGLESFDQIRALDARIPVVVLTGSDDEELGLEAIESGAQDFMAKGHITGQLLFRAIRFAIARQKKVMGFLADADTDPLTGMPNRRHLKAKFPEMLEESRANQTPMSLALLDVDHFKLVNDKHGHFIGDAVLKEVASLVTDSKPKGAIAARFGGEEFALLLPGFKLRDSDRIVTEMLQRLEDATLTFESREIKVTASAGVVEIASDENWDDVFVQADIALYKAKSSGRNRVCLRDDAR